MEIDYLRINGASPAVMTAAVRTMFGPQWSAEGEPGARRIVRTPGESGEERDEYEGESWYEAVRVIRRSAGSRRPDNGSESMDVADAVTLLRSMVESAQREGRDGRTFAEGIVLGIAISKRLSLPLMSIEDVVYGGTQVGDLYALIEERGAIEELCDRLAGGLNGDDRIAALVDEAERAARYVVLVDELYRAHRRVKVLERRHRLASDAMNGVFDEPRGSSGR